MTRETKPFIVTAPERTGLDAKPTVIANGVTVAYELDQVTHLTDAAASAIRDCDILHIEPVEQVMTAQTIEDEESPLNPVAFGHPNPESPAPSGDDDAAASPSGGSDDGGGDTPAEEVTNQEDGLTVNFPNAAALQAKREEASEEEAASEDTTEGEAE